MATRRIAIVAGGFSSEFPVSMKSAEGIKTFLEDTPYDTYIVKITRDLWEVILPDGTTSEIDKNDFSFVEGSKIKQFDFAYITIHGVPGENGALQGYFDMIGLPYSCCGVFAAALTANKYSCNQYLSNFGVKISPAVIIRPGDNYSVSDIVKQVTLPCFVKPNEGGSSFATTKVKEVSELAKAIEDAFGEGGNVIVERFMHGTEVTCGCYKTDEKSVVFPITEVVSKNEFFDYEAKYTASKVEEITPARISDDIAEEISATTSMIYDIIGAKGIIRIDYIIVQGVPYLLEVNTTPGMTVTSFIPQQIRASKLEPGKVLSEIIEDIMQTK
ncbi:MAG: D-alanine--D-alanine ligase [Bacteroidales bacterium]|nr:D-alanine--D-alanine ligase [Bacteroidales bacterium]